MGLLPLAWMIGSSIGSNLLSGLFRSQAAKKRRDKMMAQLRPWELRYKQAQLGLSGSEGSMIDSLVSQRLANLGMRGVLQGSGTAGEIAAAVAPFEVQRQGRLDEMAAGIAAAKAQMEGDVPGAGDAFAGTMGDLGQVLATAATVKGLDMFGKTTETAAPAANPVQATMGLRSLIPGYDDKKKRRGEIGMEEQY